VSGAMAAKNRPMLAPSIQIAVRSGPLAGNNNCVSMGMTECNGRSDYSTQK
jgi:hypothetical protein